MNEYSANKTQNFYMNRCSLFISVTLFVISAAQANDGQVFTPYILPIDGTLSGYHTEDLDGDQLSEIILFEKHEQSVPQRFLSIFKQSETGFSAKPLQLFPLPENVSVFDFGIVNRSGTRALVYFANDQIYFHAWTDTGFVKKPSLLFDEHSLFIYADQKNFRHWDFVTDVNQDGLDDALVPQFGGSVIYYRDTKADKWHREQVALFPEARPYAYFDPRFSVGTRAGSVYVTPYLRYADFNADNHEDIVAVYKDSLVVFLQDKSRRFSGNPDHIIPIDHGDIWGGAKIMRTHLDDENEQHYLMKILDVNHDGMLDLITTFISTKESLINPKTETRIYHCEKKNSGHYFYPDKPSYVIQPGGTQMVLDIEDFNNDGQMDFLIPSINIGVTSVIKMLLTKTVNIDAELFLMGSDGTLPKEATRKTNINVRFSFRGGAASPIYEIADFNADGFLDLLCSQDEQKLLIYWGSEENFLQSGAGTSFRYLLPQDGTLAHARDLNNDKKSDVIIQYSESDLSIKGMEKGLRVLLKN